MSHSGLRLRRPPYLSGKGGLPVTGMLGVPVLALVMNPVQAAGLLLPIFVVSDAFGLWAYRRAFDARNLMILIPASFLGIALGFALARVVPEAAVTLLVGVIGVAFCLERWLRRRAELQRRADIGRGIFWGMLTGFTSFVSHSGAPPYQIYVLPQGLRKMVYAGTTTILFAAVNAAKLIPYYALGQLSPGNLKIAALLSPIAIGATLAGVRLTRVIPERPFFVAVQIALFAVSLKLCGDGLSGLF